MTVPSIGLKSASSTGRPRSRPSSPAGRPIHSESNSVLYASHSPATSGVKLAKPQFTEYSSVFSQIGTTIRPSGEADRKRKESSSEMGRAEWGKAWVSESRYRRAREEEQQKH